MRRHLLSVLVCSVLVPCFSYADDEEDQMRALAAKSESKILAQSEKIRELTGIVEELSHRIDQLKEEFDRYQKDVDLRIEELSNGKPQKNEGKQISNKKKDNVDSEKEPSEEKKPVNKDPLKAAQEAMSNGQFQEVVDVLETALDQKGKIKNKCRAYYLIGEAQMKMKHHQEASIAFVTSFKNDPNSSAAPDTLYKLSESLLALKKNKDAKVTLKKIIDDYPNVSAALKKKVIEKLKSVDRTQ